jgi:serine/threonine protein kinase
LLRTSLFFVEQASQSEPTNQTQLLETSRTFTKYSQISLSEIAIVKELGEGSYGKVCLGKWRAAPVALKICKNKEKLDEFMNEVKLMIELPPHPNVVQVFGVSLDGPQPVIVMEYCAGGSLDTLLFDTNLKLSDEHKIRFVRGIAAGMLHLHEHNIVHRDLAARNILLTESGKPKISHYVFGRILECRAFCRRRRKERQRNSLFLFVGWRLNHSLNKLTVRSPTCGVSVLLCTRL